MSAAPLVGQAAYRKADGLVAVASDGTVVTWTPNPGTGPPTVSLSLADITNLQQTPDTNPKVMLKILAKTSPDADQAESFVFNFNTPNGRAEANAIKDVIAKRISELRVNDANVPKLASQVGAAGGESADGGAALTAAAVAAATPAWLDDARLKTDIELQHSLMKKQKSLHQSYMAAHQAKPDAISDAAFNVQFWSTRTDLLRAHAVESSQKKGAYHVLAVVKPKAVENEGLKLSLNVEQVQMILAQHPIVKRLHDQNVPRIPEADFWSKFFLSRLRKRLCGEEVLATDRQVPLFDNPGLDAEEAEAEAQAEQQRQQAGAAAAGGRQDDKVPHTIDLEANEQNQGGFKRGNMKDVEMRITKKMPIMGVINSVSKKLMAGVAPIDEELAQAGVDEATFRELALRDLAPVQDESRIELNIKEQQQRRGFFSGTDGLATAEAGGGVVGATAEDGPSPPLPKNPAEILAGIAADLGRLPASSVGGVDLHAAIGFDPNESDSEADEDGDGRAAKRQKQHHAPRVNSRTALKSAQQSLLERARQRRDELYGDADASASQLSAPLMERCVLANASTVEFLRQFWSAFLSGAPERAAELANTVEALTRSAERIAAVADDAEAERQSSITQKKRDVRAYFEKTGKKVRWNADMVGGGRAEVAVLSGSALGAISTAQAAYRKAWDEETARAEEVTGAA